MKRSEESNGGPIGFYSVSNSSIGERPRLEPLQLLQTLLRYPIKARSVDSPKPFHSNTEGAFSLINFFIIRTTFESVMFELWYTIEDKR